MERNHETGDIILTDSHEYWVTRTALLNVSRLQRVCPDVGARFDADTLSLAREQAESMPMIATATPHEISPAMANVASYVIRKTRTTAEPKVRKARQAIANELERLAAAPVVGVE
jgi:hypothetical protein